MKKILTAVMLVLVFALSLSLAACSNPVAKIEVKNGTIDSVYHVGDVIDYSKGVLTVTYEDGATDEVKFTDSGVKYNQISTAQEGSATLTVTYGGKTAEFAIEIVAGDTPINATVRSFRYPESYGTYLSRSADNTGNEDAFTQSGAVYKVGSVNKFQFSPLVEGSENGELKDLGSNVATTMKLSTKSDLDAAYTALTPDQTATYVTKSGNYYKFNEVANGEYFKMEVSLDTDIYKVADTLEETTLTIEFMVVDAYNVYDMFGLSVYDNLNVKHWANQKDRTLRWDDKKLSEYTDVTQIVLHGDIEINPDNLPKDYFWEEGTVVNLENGSNKYQRGYSQAKEFFDACNFPEGSELLGSLIDGVGDGGTFRLWNGGQEDYSINTIQKALYMTNQCSVSGNYMSLKTVEAENSGRQLVSYVTNEKNAGNNPKSHWAILGSVKTSTNVVLNLTMENVDITGNMGKSESSDGVAAGLLGLITGTDRLDITNVNMRTCYTHIIVISNSGYVSTESEYGSSAINLTDSKLTDAYSNMIYLFRTKVNVSNSVLKGAGGPLMIVVDGERKIDRYDPTDDYSKRKCSVTVDDKSVLEAYAAGTESWYSIFNAQLLFNKIKDMDQLLQGYVRLTMQHNNAEGGAEKLLNLIAVICPEPGDIMSAAKDDANRLWIKGDFIRDNGSSQETYSMEDPVYWGETAGAAGVNGGLKAYNTVLFKSGSAYAYMNTTTSLADPTGASFAAWANPSDLMCIYMNAGSGNAGSKYPYFGVILGGVHSVA
ncbi:MAG: bacterial Ig-like domain-containing protein [Corallococcus sp.]|nr:bacterial Ig-like domain-containing protein [Corallococcus sp.]MCM1359913.1 bacterial Ig-like domain-containing protein [Corallococcus sp.]MCM1395346.1 bacterial Ig-like domain-containing protein [Corallococcus sp.]